MSRHGLGSHTHTHSPPKPHYAAPRERTTYSPLYSVGGGLSPISSWGYRSYNEWEMYIYSLDTYGSLYKFHPASDTMRLGTGLFLVVNTGALPGVYAVLLRSFIVLFGTSGSEIYIRLVRAHLSLLSPVHVCTCSHYMYTNFMIAILAQATCDHQVCLASLTRSCTASLPPLSKLL